MKTHATVDQSETEYQLEIISIYPEHAKRILEILRDLSMGYRLIGRDQSNRMIYQVAFDESQLTNIPKILLGIRDLERGTHFTDLILTTIRHLLS